MTGGGKCIRKEGRSGLFGGLAEALGDIALLEALLISVEVVGRLDGIVAVELVRLS